MKEWFAPFADQRDRWIAGLPVCLGMGIALYFSFMREPSAIILLAFFIASLCGYALTVRAHMAGALPGFVLLAACLLFAGMGVAKIRTDMVTAPALIKTMKYAETTGTVRSAERLEGGSGIRVLLSDLEIDMVAPERTPRFIRIQFKGDVKDIPIGARIKVAAQLHPPEGPILPGGYDFARHAFFQQIGAYGFSFGKAEIIAYPPPDKPARFDAENIRNIITVDVDRVLDDPQAPIVIALLTGERASISDADWDALRNSGLAHLLAISGMNVDMVALIVFFAVRLALALIPGAALRLPVKKYAALCAFAVTALYVWMIVPTVPTQRSLITVGLVLLAVVLDRSPISMRLVALVASAVLLLWPEQLLGASFQLSFSAVVALIAAFEVLKAPLEKWHQGAGIMRRVALYAAIVVVTTVIATVATAPFSLYHFQSLATYGVLANALAVPLSTFYLMPAALVYYLALPLGWGDPVLHAMGAGVDALLWIAHAVAGLPGATWNPPQMGLPAFIFFVAAGLWLCAWRGRLRLAAIPLVCLAVILTVIEPRPSMAVNAAQSFVFIRDENAAAVSDRRKRRLVRDYAQVIGIDGRAITRLPVAGAWGPVRCDAAGCIYIQDMLKVALPRTREAFREDCAKGTAVVIGPYRDTPCAKGLRYQSPFTLTFWGGAAHFRAVEDYRGPRPWVRPYDAGSAR